MARILVVDDDPTMRALLRKRLEAEGHEVAEAKDGVQGVAAIRRGGVDLLVIDVLMPGKGGIEALMELREDHPDLKILIVTGHSPTESEAFQNVARQFGAARVFTKPVDFDTFLATVKKLL